MLLQRVWGARRLRNVRRLGMLGGTLASCALALATVVPSAYALACGVQSHHKSTHTSNSHSVHKTAQVSGSHVHATPTVRYVYVYKCSCGKDHHSSSSKHHGSDNHSSDSNGKNTNGKNTNSHHSSSGGTTSSNTGSNKTPKPSTSGGGSGPTPLLPLTGSDPFAGSDQN